MRVTMVNWKIAVLVPLLIAAICAGMYLLVLRPVNDTVDKTLRNSPSTGSPTGNRETDKRVEAAQRFGQCMTAAAPDPDKMIACQKKFAPRNESAPKPTVIGAK